MGWVIYVSTAVGDRLETTRGLRADRVLRGRLTGAARDPRVKAPYVFWTANR